MFSGIVLGLAVVEKIVPKESGFSIYVKLDADKSSFSLADAVLGDSVCVSGVCLTIVEIIDRYTLRFDVSAETLSCTAGLDNLGGLVNIEPSLRLDSLLGGHLVSGHVDCVGSIVTWDSVGDCVLMEIAVPKKYGYGIARKGSVAICGISLTVNSVRDSAEETIFSINLIPYTLSHTSASTFDVSTKVNVEIDMMARYVARYAEAFFEKIQPSGRS